MKTNQHMQPDVIDTASLSLLPHQS